MAQFYPISAESPAQRFAFGPDFFKRKFPDHIRLYCSLEARTTVIEIILADGLTMDVSNFEEIDNEYLLVVAFTDSHSCEDTFQSYVRYETILRINVKNLPAQERRVGFNIDRTPRDATNKASA